MSWKLELASWNIKSVNGGITINVGIEFEIDNEFDICLNEFIAFEMVKIAFFLSNIEAFAYRVLIYL